MNRKTLLEMLDLVKPALADDNIIPIFQNFCFENDRVFANRDKLAIVAPCPDIGDTFAVNGKTLTEFLKASSSEEVEMVMVNDNIVIKNGRSKIKMPYMDKSNFVFEEPEQEQWDVMLDIDETLLEALKMCLLTSTTDTTMPNFMGVTLKGNDSELNLYSCDGDSLSQYKLSKPTDIVRTVDHTITTDFIEAVLRIAEKTSCNHGQLYVNDSWAFAEFGNDFKVYGRNIFKEEPLDFDAQLKKTMKNDPTFIAIPDALDNALSRARVVADPESKATSIKIDNGKMELVTDTHIGVVKDTIKVGIRHEDVEASVSAKLIHRAVVACDGFAVFNNCTVYKKGKHFLLLVANYRD